MENRDVKKVKVFGLPWHLGHQYDLLKATDSFAEWTWLKNYRRPYSTMPRGDFMKNWVDHYEAGKYDLAVLHIDNQCVEEGIWERGKGAVYRQLNEVIQDIPKIVINHGTNFYPEKFTTDELNQKIKEVIGDNTMVVNSHTASEQFGFGTPIIHGMGEDEWWDLPKEPRVITVLSPAGLDMYYDRAFLDTVKEKLAELGIKHCQVTVDWLAKDWDDYRNFIGRSLVYFNPTKESPMPRSRTEAMFSGACVITTPHQDADRFIVDGENGFLCKRDPDYVVERILWCFENYKEAVRIGQEGKKTAHQVFSRERYGNDWRALMSKVLNREI